MKLIKNKKGSYIVEAAIVMPIFIIAMVCLVSIVAIYSAGENVFFSACDELMLADIEASIIKDSVTLPVALMARTKLENPELSYVVLTDYRYLHEEGLMEDLISVELSGKYKLTNLFFLPSIFNVSERVRGRAFIGLYKPTPEGDDMMDDDDPELVYVFPMRGEKYHNRECSFLNPACQRVFLTQDIQGKFTPCSICKSGEVQVGESVYCFFNAGKVYHRGKCSQVDKYYVEIDKRDALSQGYMPCMACGG